MGAPRAWGTLTTPPPACAGFGACSRGCRNKTPLPKIRRPVAALPGAGLWASGSVETGRLGQQGPLVGCQQAPWACMPQLHGPWAPWRGHRARPQVSRTPFAGSRVGAGCLRQPKLLQVCLEGRLCPFPCSRQTKESKPSCVVWPYVWPCACARVRVPCACLRVPVCVPVCPVCPCVPMCSSACACVCPVCMCVPHMRALPLTHRRCPRPHDPSRGGGCQQLPQRRWPCLGRVSV